MSEIRKVETDMELLEKVLSKENLNMAYKQVYKNKGASGVDGVTTKELFAYIREHKEEIIWQIRNRKYKPQPVRRVYIPKENGKMRKLGIPSVVDRVIQQAIVQVLTPIYEEQFSNNSFGFRPNRSCEMAIIKVLECFNDGYDWVVDIDLQSFFDEVNQDKLIGIIRRTIKDWIVNTANSRRGYYHIAHTRVLEQAVSKERLNKRGLVNSLDHYLKVHIITN